MLILLTLLRQWSPRSVPLRPFIPAMITLPLTQMSSPPLPPPSSVIPQLHFLSWIGELSTRLCSAASLAALPPTMLVGAMSMWGGRIGTYPPPPGPPLVLRTLVPHPPLSSLAEVLMHCMA